MNNIEKILNQVKEEEERREQENLDIEDELAILRDSFDQWILVE